MSKENDYTNILIIIILIMIVIAAICYTSSRMGGKEEPLISSKVPQYEKRKRVKFDLRKNTQKKFYKDDPSNVFV